MCACAFRGFYLWRCGTEVDADYAGNHYHIDACHLGGGHTPTDWVDEQEDYSRNEIVINWQGALVYLLAAVM